MYMLLVLLLLLLLSPSLAGCLPPHQGAVGVGVCLQPHQDDQRAARSLPSEIQLVACV
jgi:Skp family chaperone for outer membrane proteins